MGMPQLTWRFWQSLKLRFAENGFRPPLSSIREVVNLAHIRPSIPTGAKNNSSFSITKNVFECGPAQR
jgi:hypothetical protein